MAATDVELQQRHARFHHRRELARKEGDFLFSDNPPTLKRASARRDYP
jgi:hypothetical protein